VLGELTVVVNLIAYVSLRDRSSARALTETVGNHISAIFLKLGVATRAEAVVIAKDAGLGRRD
jgi:hypothetical protein